MLSESLREQVAREALREAFEWRTQAWVKLCYVRATSDDNEAIQNAAIEYGEANGYVKGVISGIHCLYLPNEIREHVRVVQSRFDEEQHGM